MPNDDIVINKINIIGRCIKQLVTAAMNADRSVMKAIILAGGAGTALSAHHGHQQTIASLTRQTGDLLYMLQ